MLRKTYIFLEILRKRLQISKNGKVTFCKPFESDRSGAKKVQRYYMVSHHELWLKLSGITGNFSIELSSSFGFSDRIESPKPAKT